MSCGTILTERAYLSVHAPFLQLARMRSGREPYSVFFQLTIQNVSTVRVQLLGRKWTIHEGNDTLRIIEGEHVFGVDPVLAPECVFGYSGRLCFAECPRAMELRFFGYDETASCFISPPCTFPIQNLTLTQEK